MSKTSAAYLRSFNKFTTERVKDYPYDHPTDEWQIRYTFWGRPDCPLNGERRLTVDVPESRDEGFTLDTPALTVARWLLKDRKAHFVLSSAIDKLESLIKYLESVEAQDAADYARYALANAREQQTYWNDQVEEWTDRLAELGIVEEE